MLMGAEVLFYPTAIGSEPHDPDLDTSRLWRRAMIGHAVSNVVPVVAANRIGTEHGQRFYGHSFICDERGDILAEFGAGETGVLVATLDLAQAKKHRAAFGFFRDRRPDLYGRLTVEGHLVDERSLEYCFSNISRVSLPGIRVLSRAMIARQEHPSVGATASAPWANFAADGRGQHLPLTHGRSARAQ